MNSNKRKKNSRVLFLVNSIMAGCFGLGFIFFPKFLYGLLGFITDEDGLLMVRFFGFVLVGASILLFLTRNIESSKTREAIMIMQTSNFTLMVITHLIVIFVRGPPLLTNFWLWTLVGTHIFMICWYLFFIIRDWKGIHSE